MNTSEGIIDRKMFVYWFPLLLLNGIDVYPVLDKKRRIVKRIAAAYPWLMCSLWLMITSPAVMSLITEHASYEQTIETLTYVTGSGSTLLLFAIGLYKRPAMYKMLAIMRDEFWYDGDRRLAADQLYWRFVRTYGVVFPVANVMMCTAPLAWTFQHDGNIGSPNAYIYHMYMPWTPTVGRYVAVYITQFVVSISVLSCVAGMVLSMIVFVNELQVQVDILVDTIRELDVDDVYSGGKLNPDRTWRSYDGLVKCVKHHQTLIKYFNNFKSYFNLLFGFELVYILIMTCLCGSSVLLAKGIHVNMMALLTIVTSQYFFYCLIGEQYSSMNAQIGNCAYFKFVKCKSPKLRRMGYLLVLRTQNPLKLTAMGISKYTASLYTFTVIIKSAYAGLNVLYSSSKEKRI